EDSNEAAFVVAVVEKIYAHESLNFNNIVACKVISKWKARLKDDIDAWSDVNMGFNKSGEYKKTFIGFGVGTGSIQVLQGVEFEVEPQEDHTFEVEPHGNVDHVDGSQEVKTHDLMDYQLVRDREKHLAYELFRYREDSNEAAFVVATVEKIYAHE
nr:zinc finger, CCHC-type [Tanacetum cinerariifolium]